MMIPTDEGVQQFQFMAYQADASMLFSTVEEEAIVYSYVTIWV